MIKIGIEEEKLMNQEKIPNRSNQSDSKREECNISSLTRRCLCTIFQTSCYVFVVLYLCQAIDIWIMYIILEDRGFELLGPSV